MMRQHEGTPLEVVYDSERIAEVRAELDRALEGWKRDQWVRDAAPDLLDALKKALPYLDAHEDCGPPHGGYQSEHLEQVVGASRAAIAKATGGANA